jgi:hypothetical protein
MTTMKSTRQWVVWALVSGLALGSLGAAARAADEAIDINKRGDEKKFAVKLGKAIVAAAHPTGKDPALSDHKMKSDDPKQTTLHLKMVYYGRVTDDKYNADIVVKFDTADKDAWKVLSIDYKDDNKKFKANKKNIDKLIAKLNGLS